MEPPRTLFAQKAVDLTKLFALAFADPLAGRIPFRMELAAPEGPSTGGGVQALQHLRLVPPGGGTTFVIGSTSGVLLTAELRTLARLRQLHQQRFPGAALPLEAGAYGELLARVERFFVNQSFQVTWVDAEPELDPLGNSSGTAGALLWKLALGAGVVGLCLAAYWLGRMQGP